MTNQQQPPPFAPKPPSGYWLLHASRQSQAKAIKNGRTMAAERFVKQVKAGVDALVRREPDGEKRLAAYRMKPLELWDEHRAKFPDCGAWWDFAHSMQDWQRLAPFDPRRNEVVQYIADMELAREQQAVLQPQAV